MQVTMSADDWEQLTAFGSAEEYLAAESEDAEPARGISCFEVVDDWSDSAIRYLEMAAALIHLADICEDDEMEEHLDHICKIISKDELIDEFGLAEPTEGLVSISASPTTVREIKSHFDALDYERCKALLEEEPPYEADYITQDLDGRFFALLDQYRKMVDVAVSRGYGLLGYFT